MASRKGRESRMESENVLTGMISSERWPRHFFWSSEMSGSLDAVSMAKPCPMVRVERSKLNPCTWHVGAAE